jgi:hypothetical protein
VAAGRDPATLGMEGRVSYKPDLDTVATRVESWRTAGATHVSINTMGAGLGGVDAHIAALAAVAGAARLAG